jgi:hypothetical protein
VPFALLISSCGARDIAEVELVDPEEPPSCEQDPRLFDKQWLVGGLDTSDDDPTFSVTITLTDVAVQGEGFPEPAFSREPGVFQARFEITREWLLASPVDAPASRPRDALAAFPIRQHVQSSCRRPYPVTGVGPERLPWEERRWLYVDWARDGARAACVFHRFDAAWAAGYPNAARCEPLERKFAYELSPDEGTLVTRSRVFIAWRKIDDDTPGCIFDFPDLLPGTQCPHVEVDLRYEFRKNGLP